jgi:hypothetical protein
MSLPPGNYGPPPRSVTCIMMTSPPPRSEAVFSGRLVCGASALLVVMIMPGAAMFRVLTILALALGLCCFLLRRQIRSFAGRTDELTGLMVAVALGAASTSLVQILVPLSIVPAALLVLAPAALWWLVRSFRRASAVIDATVQEFATPNSYEPGSRTDRAASVSTHRTALH